MSMIHSAPRPQFQPTFDPGLHSRAIRTNSKALPNPMANLRHLILATSLCSLVACGTPNSARSQAAWPGGVSFPDVAISHAPFENTEVNWKQRLAEPYIYLDHTGDYRLAGARIAELMGLAADQKAPVHGAPFILFYDDPGKLALDELQARICIAIDADFSSIQPLLLDNLPAQTVVYAAIGGPYDEVARGYGGIFKYMAGRGWKPGVPIRESYLVSPVGTPPADLVTEVQIPWVPGG